MNKQYPRSVWSNPIHFIACGFGSGLLPKAPGTFGTVVAIPIYLLLHDLPLPLYSLILAALFAFGVWICDVTAKDIGVHDHPSIVFDEIVGYLVTMWLGPSSVFAILLGFALFRVFDIIKPPPIGWLDKKVKGGVGIMVDDVVAGLMALVVLQIIMWFIN